MGNALSAADKDAFLKDCKRFPDTEMFFWPTVVCKVYQESCYWASLISIHGWRGSEMYWPAIPDGFDVTYVSDSTIKVSPMHCTQWYLPREQCVEVSLTLCAAIDRGRTRHLFVKLCVH